MKGYSALRLFVEGLGGQKGWGPAWRSPAPKGRYDAIVIGGGGHGLATAYYLAKLHGITNVAVLERGWLGGGNTGRNTTIIRSNYYYPQSARLYDFSLKLYEGLSRDLNYNIMFSQRGMVIIANSRHELESATRWVGAMRLNGIDTEMVDVSEIERRIPILDTSRSARLPVWGGFIQKRAGTARHDAVAWGFARAADALGVDIIQNCEVRGFRKDASGRVAGVETSLGFIAATRIGMAAAGHSTVVADMAGVRLPVTSYALQAFVSEPLKPVLDTVMLSLGTGLYVSQSDKGGLVFGGALDQQRRGRGRRPDAVAGPGADRPPLGRHRRRRSRLEPDPRPDAGPRPLHQLRLGHRRLQGDPGRGLSSGPPSGHRPAA
jgi:sarcosine oxidase subunit beta